MYRWGQLQDAVDIRALARQVYRPDIYAEVAAALGVPCPRITHKTEGTHRTAWTLHESTQPVVMGPDCFIDECVYDPVDLCAYIDGFTVNALQTDRDRLRRLNPRSG
jgi:nitrate/nitrite transport system substrate-binding protein